MQATPSNHGRQLVLRRLVTFGMAAGVFAALVGCPNSARADFDKTLALKVAPDLLKYLRDNGYHSVGVLKFRVKRGNEPESFYVGPLNDTLVTRLENALVYKCDEGDSFQLLQNPSAEAAQQKQKLSYLNPAGRAKLLELEYPLAFGDEKARVKPDVFLTGLVEIRPLEHRATLTIEAFSQKSKDLTKVGSFEVPLDRAILVDAGMPFAIPKTLAPSDAAASEATAHAKKPAEESLLAITVLYGGEPQSIVRKGPAGEFSVPEPTEKQRVAI